MTLQGAAYDGGDVVGIVELKLGKVSKGQSKVSGSVTTLDGKKYTAKGVTVTGIDGTAPATVSLEVKGLGTMTVAIGGAQFAGNLGGTYHVQSASVGGAWEGGTAVAAVEPGDLSAFAGTALADFLPTNEVATVKNGKWTFAKAAGVKCVTYMPTRNTPAQLERLRGLCDAYGMFQISGEDINTPRQSFIIKAMENPMFANLIDATWKLIEHEK